MSSVPEIGAVNETSVVCGSVVVAALPASASLVFAVPAAGESRSGIASTGPDGAGAATCGVSTTYAGVSLGRRRRANEFRSEWRVCDARAAVRSGFLCTAVRVLGRDCEAERNFAIIRSDQAM